MPMERCKQRDRHMSARRQIRRLRSAVDIGRVWPFSFLEAILSGRRGAGATWVEALRSSSRVLLRGLVALLGPKGVEYYTMPGFNFGLAAAPNQCCRVSVE